MGYCSSANETISIAGKNQSLDVFRGGAGFDVLNLTSGDDVLFLDSSGTQRIFDIQHIFADSGNDIVDLTSQSFSFSSVAINGGSGNDVL